MELQLIPDMERSAVFSPERLYRYALRRIWDHHIPPMLVVGFNPSKADEAEDDPTIRKCIGYARRWGYGGLLMGNVFAYQATNPKALSTTNPVGEPSDKRACGWRNDDEILRLVDEAALVVAAWGAIKSPQGWEDRAKRVRDLLGPRAHALGTTAAGHPLHPLYTPNFLRPVPLPLEKAL